MTTYNPDRWVIIRISDKTQSIDKLLTGWSGSYLEGQSWKISSGVIGFEQDGDMIKFHNHSGSVYNCHREAEGFTTMSYSVLQSYQRDVEDSGGEYKIEVIDFNNWIKEQSCQKND